MTTTERLRKLETSLPPKDAVLMWLNEMLELGEEAYAEKMFEDPRNPRVLIVKAVAEAARENLNEPPLKPELLEHAVREAMKQADTLILLILNLHEHVRSECRLNDRYAELLCEKSLRMVLAQSIDRPAPPEEWDRWQERLAQRLNTLWRLRKTVLAISARYYNGHPLLFARDESRLNDEIELLEDLRNAYKEIEHNLAGWKAIDFDAQSRSMAEQVEAQVAELVTTAKAKTLADFGEEEAARELLDSVDLRYLRELKRLRSSGSLQENVTS